MWYVIKKLSSLKTFYKMSGFAWPFFAIITAILLMYGIFAGLFIAPADFVQGEGFRIIYIHVPSAILSLMIYGIMGVNSIIYMIWRIKIADIIAASSASIGASFTVLALITGALWGKPMWGTWWIWDARLTSELILLFLYLGYIGFRQAFKTPLMAARASALLAIIGLIDIPIVHYSVVWWNTLHQGASISQFKKPSIDIAMLYPLIAMFFAFTFFYLTILLLHSRLEIIEREQHTRWVRKLLRKQYD